MDSKLIELSKIAHNLVANCMGTRPGETVLIVTDTLVSSRIPMALAAQARAIGADPVIVTMTPRTKNGEDPPAAVAEAMKRAQVILAPTTASIYHTSAKHEAQKAGARGVLKVLHVEELWYDGGMSADFFEIRKKAEILAGLLRKTDTARVTTPAGTDLTMRIAGREPKGWLCGICRNPGDMSAMPGGEVSLPPIEETAQGIVLVEVAMTEVGAVRNPIRMIVEKGKVVRIEGAEEAHRLREIIRGVENATNIAELGIGLNPKAKLIGEIYESKKRLGTIHIGIGDNTWGYGGDVSSDIHLDGLMLDVTLELDGQTVIKDGQLLF